MLTDKIKEFEYNLIQTGSFIERVDVLMRYAWEIRVMDTVMARKLTAEAHQLSLEHNYLYGLASAYRMFGVLDWRESKYDSSVKNLKQAIEICTHHDYADLLIASEGLLGMVYAKLGDYSKSLSLYFGMLEVIIKNKLWEDEATVNNEIGKVFSELGEKEKSLSYFNRTLEILKDNLHGKLTMYKYVKGGVYTNLGKVYFEMDDPDKALDFFLKARQAYSEDTDELREADVLLRVGEVYAKLNNEESAEKYYRQASEMSGRIGDKYGVVSAYCHLGQLFLAGKKEHLALDCLDKALTLASEIKAKPLLLEIHYSYYRFYKQNEDYEQAFSHYFEGQKIEQTIQDEQVANKTKALEIRFEIDKIEKEREKEIIRIKNIDMVKANNEILLQKELLESKNKDITASIQYAKRIQEAILPSEKYIEELLPESFVLFRPKEIVSGDFYWVERWGNTVLFSVVDCTGHGVPGAFMSIVGYNLLSQAVNAHLYTRPSDILVELNKELHKMFNKDEISNENHHISYNVEIGLCAYNPRKGVLEFAGSHHSMWLVRKGEIIRIEGDRMPLGDQGNAEERIFTNHSIEVQKDDVIYLFTDGYSDQFGGFRGKKFKYKKLMELVLSIQSYSMQEQKKILAEIYDSWKGEFAQLDDILVMGVRF